MAEDQQIKKLLKKIDAGDIKVLAIGVVLLIIPVLVLLFFSAGDNKRISQEKMKTMAVRKNIFNFGKTQSGAPVRATGGKIGSGWLSSESPEKKVEAEIEEAMKLIKRSRRTERFPPGTNELQKQAYRAEHFPALVEGRGELERGNFALAETLLNSAFEDARDNIFQQVYAIGALCELYELTGDKKKLEAAFKKYMELVGKLPPEYGGGDLAASVRNAYMALKQLKESADPGKVADGLSEIEAVKMGVISKDKVMQGLAAGLESFPVKFD